MGGWALLRLCLLILLCVYCELLQESSFKSLIKYGVSLAAFQKLGIFVIWHYIMCLQ